MPLVVFTALLWIARRVRPVSVAFALYETWRRLPPHHRRRLLVAARRHGPSVASVLVRRRGRLL